MRKRGSRPWLFLLVAALLGGLAAWWLLAGSTGEGGGARPLADDGASQSSGSVVDDPGLGTTPGNKPQAPAPARLREGRIRGVVLGAGDEPVADTEVILRRDTRFVTRDRFGLHSPPPALQEPIRTRTDAHGWFRFDGLATEGAHPLQPGPRFIVEAVVRAPQASTRAYVGTGRHVHDQAVILRILEGREVHARVVDASGRGVSAVILASSRVRDQVLAVSAGWGFGPAKTEGDGRFVMRAVPGGPLQFEVFVGSRVHVRFHGVQAPEAGELVLKLGGESPGRIACTVRDPGGAPVARAHVLVEVVGEEDRTCTHLGTTDSNGALVLTDVAVGTVRHVSARAPGFVDGDWRRVGLAVVPGADTPLVLTLRLEARLVGRVTSAQGAPVAGARVGAYRSGFLRPEGVCDADGRYEVRGLAPGEYQLYVLARGYYDARGPRVYQERTAFGLSWRGSPSDREAYRLVVPEAGVTLERDFRMERGLSVTGLVLGVDGDPVAGAPVFWAKGDDPKHPRSPGGSPVAVTDAEGRFTHPGLGPPEGVWTFGTRVRDAASESVHVTDFSHPVEVSLRLQRLGAIGGRVLDPSGDPARRVIVRLDRRPGLSVAVGLTDDEGGFRFEGLPAATYAAMVVERPAGSTWVDLGTTGDVQVGMGKVSEGLEIHCSEAQPRLTRRAPPRPARTRVIEGIVLAPDGTPVESGQVFVRPDEGSSRSSSILGGRFRLKVDPNTSTVNFNVVDPRDTRGRAVLHAPFGLRVSVGDGPFTLHLTAGGAIAGRVVDEQGEGVEGATVTLEADRHAHRREPLPRSRTDANGAFRLEGLAEGWHTLRIEIPPEFVGSRKRPAETGMTDLEVTFTRGGIIAGRVLGPDGEGMAGVQLAAMPESDNRAHWKNGSSEADGSFRFVGLAAGEIYTVRARPGVGNPARSDLMNAYATSVRPGTTDVVLEVARGAYVKGTLLLPDGAPAAGHFVAGSSPGVESASRSVKSDAEGAFRVGPFPPGTRVSLIGYSVKPTELPATLRDVVAPATGITLRLGVGLTREGQVRGENLADLRWTWWRPIEQAQAEGGLHTYKGNVGADGRFVLGLLPQKGTVTVYVYARDSDRYALAENVKVRGEPVVLELQKGLVLAGRIDEALAARSGTGLFVRVRSLDTGIERYADTRGGSFRARGLPPGRYEVSLADHKAKWVATVEAEAGHEDVVLR